MLGAFWFACALPQQVMGVQASHSARRLQLLVSTPELDDVVRLEDRYGRAGTSEP